MISPQFFSDWPTANIVECLEHAQKELDKRGVPSTTVVEFSKLTCEQLAFFRIACADEIQHRHAPAFDVRGN